MDDYDIYIVEEDDDDARNADHRTSGGWRRGPGLIRTRRPGRVVRPARVSGGGRTVVVGGGRAVAPAGGRPVFGNLTTGELIEAAAQVLAAMQPLPAPPVATGSSGVDVSNLILYQSALATHAKRDEQLRTVGSLIGKLID